MEIQFSCDFISGAANTTSRGLLWEECEPDFKVIFYCISNVVAVVDVSTQVKIA